MRVLSAMLGAFLILLLAGCGGEESLEDQVRSYIDQVEESAEARDWRAFDDYLADDYADDRGLQKEEVLAIITRYIVANQRIHILKRVASLKVEDSGSAHAVVYVAMAGQPVSGPEDLPGLTADIYRFDIDLRAGEDGVFRTSRGDWRPVTPEQYLIGR